MPQIPYRVPIVTHNHPSSNSFSGRDVAVMASFGIRETRVCSEYYNYPLINDYEPTFEELGYKTFENFYHLHYRYWNELYPKYQEMYDKIFSDVYVRMLIKKKHLSHSDEEKIKNDVDTYVNWIHSHEATKKFAAHVGWKYSRTKIKEGWKP